MSHLFQHGETYKDRTTTYKADVITGHHDKHYTTPPPTAITMNATHADGDADIHQLVSKPVGISHVYAIRHFKKPMGGADRVCQNVGKFICRISSKIGWWPLLLYFLDIYIYICATDVTSVSCLAT